MILLFAMVNRKQCDTGHPYVATSIFAFGYLAAWAGFSLVTVILQWGFELAGILSPMLVATNVIFGGFLLLAAGVYQLTRSSMPVFATADRRLHSLVPMGGGVPVARYAWVFCTAYSASAVAGS